MAEPTAITTWPTDAPCDQCASVEDVRHIPDPENYGVHAWNACAVCRSGGARQEWPLTSCPLPRFPGDASLLNEVGIVQSLVNSGILHHHVDLDGNCWGDSQTGTCLFSIARLGSGSDGADQ